MKTIQVKGQNLTLKYSLRNFFVFESITNYPFNWGKLTDEYLLFYCTLLAHNESFKMEFDEFIKTCDEDTSLFKQFGEFMLQELKLQGQQEVKKKTPKKRILKSS